MPTNWRSSAWAGRTTPTVEQIAERLDKFYPSTSDRENRELVQLLVFLNSPTVIEKTLKLMQKKSESVTPDLRELIARNPGYAGPIAAMLANHPDLQRVHYAFALRNMKYGWTLEERKQYFGMLAELRTKSGGASYQKFIDNIRADALLNASDGGAQGDRIRRGPPAAQAGRAAQADRPGPQVDGR